MQGASGQGTDMEDLVGLEQVIELGAVEAKLRLQVEDVLEGALDAADAFADGNAAAQLPAQIGRGGKMVGVGVGFQQPRSAERVAVRPECGS